MVLFRDPSINVINLMPALTEPSEQRRVHDHRREALVRYRGRIAAQRLVTRQIHILQRTYFASAIDQYTEIPKSRLYEQKPFGHSPQQPYINTCIVALPFRQWRIIPICDHGNAMIGVPI